MRLPTKPGQTPTSTAILPILLASFIEVAITSLEVWSARTTSSSFITLAGEKKCRPITASGRLVTEAISSMFRPEVLVARIAPGLQMASSLVKMSFLTSMRSNTASMTRSQSASVAHVERAGEQAHALLDLVRLMPPRVARALVVAADHLRGRGRARPASPRRWSPGCRRWRSSWRCRRPWCRRR